MGWRFLTIRHIINEGYLGKIIEFESHFDRYTPLVTRAEWRYSQENGGGTLFDLGPHLIDQAIALFGLPYRYFVFCTTSVKGVRLTTASISNCYIIVMLLHSKQVCLLKNQGQDIKCMAHQDRL